MYKLEQEVEKLTQFEQLKNHFPVEWNEDAYPLLKERYLVKDDNGTVIETNEQLIYRVATTLTSEPSQIEKFYHMMASAMFLPNTPTLVNASRPLKMLSACLVLPTGDSIEEWGKTIHDHMIMTKAGIGTGMDLSPLRQEGAMISSTKGQAAGALAFLDMLNKGAEIVVQGSIRPSANMATMRITHPDVMDFIKSKASEFKYIGDDNEKTKTWDKLKHFNISITATDEEMEALFLGKEIPIIEPHTGRNLGSRNGAEILNTIAHYVWDGGDPGLLNLTKANKNNPIINLINPITGEAFGFKWATNPCGEQWLYVYSVCNLGSINLTKFVLESGKFDFGTFSIYVEWGVEFLDAVIDANEFPVPEINILTRHLRNIGLGIMGWADLLLMLEIPYDSDRAIALADNIMNVFKNSADYSSHKIAEKDGVAPVLRETKQTFRNYERSCIAPTGSIATILGVSTGIEPNFTFAYTRNTSLKDGTKFHNVNWVMKDIIRKYNPEHYDEILDEIINNNGMVTDEIASKIGLEENFLKTTFDVSPEWHIRHQAIFQHYVDNAVSKTINVPEDFTEEQIKDAYKLSWELGCKGITIYRDKSRSYQILNTEKKKKVHAKRKRVSPLIEQIKEEIFSENKNKIKVKSWTSTKENSKESEKIIATLNTFKSLNDCCENPKHVKEEGCTRCLNCIWTAC